MEHWNLKPGDGLGPLEFGMAEADAMAAGAIFGELTFRSPEDAGPSEADEIYEALVEAEGEEVATQVMAEMIEDGVDLRTRRQLIFDGGLILDFVDDGLEEITCSSLTPHLHIDDLPFFGADCLPALRRLATLNGAPPLVQDRDCVFVNLHLTAFECLYLMPAGLVRARREGTDEAQQKTVGWRANPRNPQEDFAGYVPVDLGV